LIIKEYTESIRKMIKLLYTAYFGSMNLENLIT